jgi:hypothetical protein
MVCFNDKAFRQKAEADPMTILHSPTSLRTAVSSIVWTRLHRITEPTPFAFAGDALLVAGHVTCHPALLS